jgi:hypothetical protein
MSRMDRVPFHERADLLAHYTRASAAFEDILPERRLRLEPYRLMRDPHENKDLLPGTAWYGERPDIDKQWNRVCEGIKRIRGECRVLSLTDDAEGVPRNFGSCWARPRLWEQYADAHRGVSLLVFDQARVEKMLRDDFAKRASFYIKRVTYKPEGIAGSASRIIVDETLLDDATWADATAAYIEAHHEDFFFCKP